MKGTDWGGLQGPASNQKGKPTVGIEIYMVTTEFNRRFMWTLFLRRMFGHMLDDTSRKGKLEPDLPRSALKRGLSDTGQSRHESVVLNSGGTRKPP